MAKDSVSYNERIYALFNAMLEEAHKAFFAKEFPDIPDVVFSVDLHCRETILGYCSPNAFRKKGKEDNKDKTEGVVSSDVIVDVQFIAINPSLFNVGFTRTFATFVHELCHLYESKYIGIARNNYHTKEWERLMRQCNLDMEFSSSRQGASTVIPDDGKFISFVDSFKKKYPELYLPIEKACITGASGKTQKKNKIKYECACGNKVWGRQGLSIYCTRCDSQFKEQSNEGEDEV